MSFNIEDFGVVSGNIIAVSKESGTAGWYIAPVPNNLDAPEWTTLTTPDTSGELRVIGQMAYQVVDGGDVFWVDALLCNSATVLDVDPFIVYVDPRTDEPVVKFWTDSYPDDEGGTADSMPHAGRCTMWGDFLVLGDINWKADPDVSFTSGNQSRYSHGLWFSIPGKTDTWDPIDTVFTGQKAGGNVVQGMFPLENGLLVITCTLIAILQGSPDDFIYRELREGISNCGRNGSSKWAAKGGVVFGNNYGEIWFTNGESFQRFDESIELSDFQSITAFGENIFASDENGIRVFRLYEDSGGWTRLTATSGFAKMLITERFLIGIEAREAGGSFILDDEDFGDLGSEYLLWSADRLITAFDFDSEERGVFNGNKIRSTIRSRPFPGFGHEVRFWHRFGVRAKGTGSLVKAISRPSSEGTERGYDTRIRGDLRRRFDYVFDAHGPSIEATFDVEFDGDASVEHMTVWEHGGRLNK
jgi:hypothetical protein